MPFDENPESLPDFLSGPPISFPPGAILRKRLQSALDLEGTRCAPFYDMLADKLGGSQYTALIAATAVIFLLEELQQALEPQNGGTPDPCTRAILRLLPFTVPYLIDTMLGQDPARAQLAACYEWLVVRRA